MNRTEPSDPPARLLVLKNARLATLAQNGNGGDGLGIIEHGVLGIRGETIGYVGPQADLPAAWQQAEVVDCEGRWITPGLIDCHTHLVHAGVRWREFELRLQGASYAEIAAAGGGIVSSVRELRAASPECLLKATLPRLDALIAEGVTTVEIKSGYGLDLENELKSLRVARSLSDRRDVTVTTTYLGAHALPADWQGSQSEYVDHVIEHILPAVAAEGLADAVDAFCEKIAFAPDDVRRLFAAARQHGLPVKLHADQLSNLHGAKLAAAHGALSADHLEYTDEEGAAAMARAGTVAVLLPGACYYLRESRYPPVGLFRQYGTRMALATDNNPGTSPLTSLLLTMNMGATLFRMSVDECLAGVTREAARALGCLATTGTLEAGKSADLAIWNIDHPAELVCRIGFNPLHRRIHRGRITSLPTQP